MKVEAMVRQVDLSGLQFHSISTIPFNSRELVDTLRA